MADPQGIAGEVEGDYSVVKVQLAGGPKEGKPVRPTKGTQLVWGGTDASSPWGHLAALIEKGGGSVNYTFVHAADLSVPDVQVKEEPETPMDEQPPEENQAASGGKKDEQSPAGDTQSHNAGGAEGHGPLFEHGADFQFGGNVARVWAHPHTFFAGPRPLVVVLHGINGKSRKKHPSLDESGVHVGKLTSKLVDDGKVTPLIIAAPTEFSDAPWRAFDLAKFVDAVKAAVASQSVQIDEDQVSVVGHSGAGGSKGAGLNKLADDGGKFGEHSLKVFGIADTCITTENAKEYATGLKENKTTAIYAIHKGTGGWQAYGGSQSFARALGADQVGKATEPAENPQDVDDNVYDNGGKTPVRASIRIKLARIPAQHKEWTATGGYHGDVGAHNDMVPMWFWWAMPRFYAATEDDKHKGLQVHPQPIPEPEEGPTLPVTGGEWANVAPAAPKWTPPGVDPKPHGAAIFAPPSGIYWPVRNAKSEAGRAISYLGDDNKGYGFGKGSSNRHFLAERPGRYHVGIDVYGDFHDIIVACEAGVVVNAYPFYPNDNPLVSCLIVQHDSGVVINYGEVDPPSLKKYGIKKGVRVQPGQPIAEVGRMVHDSMLHFETYPSGATRNVSVKKEKADQLLRSIYNPTQYLLALATKGK